MAKKSQNCQNCIWFIVFVWPSYSQLYFNIIDKAKYNQVFPYTILVYRYRKMSLGFNVKNEELSVTTSGLDEQNTNPSKNINNRILGLLWFIMNKYYLPFIIFRWCWSASSSSFSYFTIPFQICSCFFKILS